MKFHRKRIRLIKGLALAGCSLGLALPTVAGAMPIDGPLSGGRTAPVVVIHPHGRPQLPQANYTLPSSFKTDAQSQAAGAGSRTFVLSASHKSDVPSSAPSQTTAPTSTVVREIRTVQSDDNHTLAIVLAAAALGIALCGTGYAISRQAQLQRRVVGSSS
jgi:hypothetical protein